MKEQTLTHRVLNLAVIVAALGYFVDIYDLLLFGIVRTPSLQALGVSGDQLMNQGANLLNWQMTGMLLGGIAWGIWGDKQGRLSVLFGSITLYSIANILNGMVNTLPAYSACRFAAGLGLAGELGAGITLVSEVMTSEQRGLGTTTVAAFGIFGAVIASLVAKLFDWRMAYYVGGGLGIALLILRVSAYESGMFHQMRKEVARRGNFLSLFSSWNSFGRYARGILIGIPIWYIIGILILFSPEFATALHIGIDPSTGKTTITGGNSIMAEYGGAAIGALFCGLLSQRIKSRKRALWIFMVADCACVFIYLALHQLSATAFYIFIFLSGIPNGYWSVFITSATEQFGTNIRATVTTTTPNFVRGSVIPMTSAFIWLKLSTGSIVSSALIIGVIVFALAFISLYNMKETFGKELGFVEEF